MLSLLLFFVASLSACTAELDKDPFVQVVKDQCAGAEKIEFEPKEDYVEIEYHCDGTAFEIAVDYNHKLIYSESVAEIPIDVLGKIEKKLNKKYSGWSQDEYALIEMRDTAFYKFEMIRDGVEENAYFTLDGKYFQRSGITVISDELFAELAKTDHYTNAPYDYLNPAKIYGMPDILIEISGIAWAGDQTLYCVQDEVGAVFSFNLESEEVEDVTRFSGEGDFEDIAVSDDEVYVLRSDGQVYHFNRTSGDVEINDYRLQLQCLDAEGLFFGDSAQSLYVACKEAGESDNENERTIYRFDSSDTESSGSFTIDTDDINDFIDGEYPDANISEVQFNPSAFAIHPSTGQRYVLSADDRMLVVYGKKELEAVYLLPEELYYKPEGLTFAPNGDLFLSSEGVKNGPIPGQIYHLPSRK